jgi:hypothetical protein
LRTHWRGLPRFAGLGLLLAGVAVRAFVAYLKQATPPHSSVDRWLIVWRERRAWMSGYSTGSSSVTLPVNAGARS